MKEGICAQAAETMVADELTIAAVGDICLGGLPNMLLNSPSKIIPEEVTRELCGDIVFGNLEAPFSEMGETTEFGFLFAEPQSVEVLRHAGFNVVNLANNHIADCHYEGILTTIKILDEYGIQHTGAGVDLTSARKPAIFEFPSQGISIAVHGYVETNFGNREAQEFMIATSRKPGVAPLHRPIVEADIKNSKKEHDLVIVSIHWSEQSVKNMAPWRMKVCKNMIEHGADLILGHHPHVLQGYMKYKGALFLGSLGNFYFPPYEEPDPIGGVHYWSNNERESVIFKAKFKGKKLCESSFIPVIQNEDIPILRVAREDQGELMLHELQRLKAKMQSPLYPIHYFLKEVLLTSFVVLMRNPSKIVRAKRFCVKIRNEARTWKYPK